MQNNYLKKIHLPLVITCTGAIFVVTGVLYFLIGREAKFVENEYSKLQELERSADQTKVVEGLKERIADDLAKIDGRYVTNDDTIMFIDKLESFAVSQDVDINIDGISTEPAVESSMGLMKISWTIGGSWANLLMFIANLNKFDYIMKIEKIRFVKDSAEGKSGLWLSVAEVSVPLVSPKQPQ